MPQTSNDTLAQVNLHVIDEVISDIASEYQFTVQEVKESYDRCGEMQRTRGFRKMRLGIFVQYCGEPHNVVLHHTYITSSPSSEMVEPQVSDGTQSFSYIRVNRSL